MVYIYKKTIGNKSYYYLRASERRNGRIIAKDIAYLGGTLEEARKNLEKSEHREKIRKAYRTINLFLESNHYLEKAEEMKLKKDHFLLEKTEQIEACKIHYNQHFRKLDELTKKEILKNFVIEFSFNTTSIEGNTINLEEARNLLQEGITPKDKTLREIYDLQNTEKVFSWLYGNVKDIELNHETIIKIHDNLLENIDLRKSYRTTDIRVVRSNFDAAPGIYVKTDMTIILDWYNNNKNMLHPLVLAAVFHHKFEKIHPFMDGNGRTGRMLANLILLKNNLPPMVFHKKMRNEYLDAMRAADRSGLKEFDKKDYLNLIQFAADEMVESYWNIFL